MAEWRFPSNDFGEIKGINDSGVAMFRGTPLKSLAREICQNSLDAAVEDRIRIEFSLFEINNTQIPGHDALEDTFNRCLDFWSEQKAKATKEFFTSALNAIYEEKCYVLRISDFNTKGLTGSRGEINTDWTNLTKSSGASDKRGTAGGSYGIGKFAPFVCSYYSTVFYSTYDINEEKAYQGVSRLVTFTRNDGENTQGTGYFGNERNTPVYEELHLDPSFARSATEYGTDIFILGYKYSGDEWEKELLISVLDGFLGAIWNDKLEVVIGNKTICKDNLGSIIDEYRDDLTGYTDHYYNVLTSPDTNWFEDDFHGLGSVKLGILIGEHEAVNKISMVRKTGMKIMDKDHLPGHVPYMGFMFINGDKLNASLRALENPEHTKWEPDRDPNPAKAKQLLKALNEYIRDKIEELISNGDVDSIDAAGVGQYLPDDDDSADNKTKEEQVTNTIVDIDISQPKTPSSRSVKSPSDNESQDDDTEPGTNTPGGSEEDWPHPGGHSTPSPKPPIPTETSPGGDEPIPIKRSVMVNKVVCLCIDKDKGEYMMKINPLSDADNGQIDLFLSAETQKYPAPIKSATLIGGTAELSGNSISGIPFTANKEIRLKIELDYYDYCSMEVELYEIKA